MPLMTCPKAVCRPSSWGGDARAMQNCDPAESGSDVRAIWSFGAAGDVAGVLACAACVAAGDAEEDAAPQPDSANAAGVNAKGAASAAYG